MATRTVTDRTLQCELVHDTLMELAGNLTRRHFRPQNEVRAVMQELSMFARRTIALALDGPNTRPDLNDPHWKKALANASSTTQLLGGLEDMVKSERLRIEQRFSRTVVVPPGLAEYGLHKVAAVSGICARMIICGLSPELLRLSYEDSHEQLLAMAAYAQRAGVPVVALAVT